jgi:hypothetical protein
MTKEEEKKAREKAVFQSFCKETVDLLVFADFDDCETPDFLKRDGSLGVELVAYHRDADESQQDGSNLHRSEVVLERLLEDAEASFPSAMQHVEVYAFPRHLDSTPIYASKTEKAAFVEDLVAYVLASCTDEHPVRFPSSLAQFFDAIEVHKIQPYQRTNWQVVSANFVDVSVGAIQAHLREKERLVPQCRERAREVWLLLYGSEGVYVGPGNHGRWSTCGQVTPQLESMTFSSSFDRVYYFDQDFHDERKYARLKLC